MRSDHRHPDAEHLAQRGLEKQNHLVDRLVGHGAGSLQSSEGRVRHQVGVAVNETGQHGAGILPHLDTVRHVDSARLDADDPVSVEQHSGTAGTRLPSRACSARIACMNHLETVECRLVAPSPVSCARAALRPVSSSRIAPMGPATSGPCPRVQLVSVAVRR